MAQSVARFEFSYRNSGPGATLRDLSPLPEIRLRDNAIAIPATGLLSRVGRITGANFVGPVGIEDRSNQ
jgi:hypothetical protein